MLFPSYQFYRMGSDKVGGTYMDTVRFRYPGDLSPWQWSTGANKSILLGEKSISRCREGRPADDDRQKTQGSVGRSDGRSGWWDRHEGEPWWCGTAGFTRSELSQRQR